MIDYTMYVSSRTTGTRPFRYMKPQAFHERQWETADTYRGHISGHRSLELAESPSSHNHARALSESRQMPDMPAPKTRRSELLRLFRQTSLRKLSLSTLADHTELPPSTANFSAGESPVELLDAMASGSVEERSIPNAAFARKFSIYAENDVLPPSLKELPVAEEKLTNEARRSVSQCQGSLQHSGYHGPLTPQLWFDSGLDYCWRKKNTSRRSS